MKKKPLIAIIIIILIAAAAISAFLFYPLKIAFYAMNEDQINFITDSIEENKSLLGIKKRIKYIENKPSESLDSLTKKMDKPDLLFTSSASALKKNSEDMVPLSETAGALIPPPSRELYRNENLRYAYPLQLDHIELAYHIRLFSRYGLNPVNSLSDLTILTDAFDQLKKDGFIPLMVAGGENSALLDFVSLMLLSYGGPGNYTDLMEILSSDIPFEDKLSYASENKISLKEILDVIVSWEKSEYLHPEWTRFTQDDLIDSLESGYSGAAVMRLSAHRKIPYRLISKFSSIIFPFADPGWNTSAIIVPAQAIAVPSGIFRNSENTGILQKLLETPFQEALNKRTGLGPINSSSITLDLQSTQVRFWGAASRMVLNDIGSEAFSDTESLDNFAEQTRLYLEAGKLAR